MSNMNASDTAGLQRHNRNGTRPPDLAGQFRVHRQILNLTTEAAPQFVDITSEVKGVVAESGITEGTVLIFSLHTTAAIVINEHEPLLLKDFAASLNSLLAKDGRYYAHNDFAIRTVNMHEGECPNGHSHCQQLLLDSGQTIPVADGRPMLGQFQSVFMVELDEPKARRVCVQVQGI